jgi:hypothetical protein
LKDVKLGDVASASDLHSSLQAMAIDILDIAYLTRIPQTIYLLCIVLELVLATPWPRALTSSLQDSKSQFNIALGPFFLEVVPQTFSNNSPRAPSCFDALQKCNDSPAICRFPGTQDRVGWIASAGFAAIQTEMWV